MDQSKKPNGRETKAQIIERLKEKIAKAKVIIFADYHGLGANQISDLRAKVKEAGGELLIVKNTLLSRALQISSAKWSDQTSNLEGPTAVVFAYEDEVSPVKAVSEIAKSLGLPKFKFGFFGQDLLEKDAVEKLAKIPGLDVLQGKIVGALASPIYGCVSVLQANIRNLVFVLNQVAKRSGTSP